MDLRHKKAKNLLFFVIIQLKQSKKMFFELFLYICEKNISIQLIGTFY